MKSFYGVFQLLLIATFVVLFVRLAVGRGAIRSILEAWREAPRRPAARFFVATWIAVFVVDLYETRYDGLITRALRVDYTPILHRLEGGAVAALQSLAVPSVTVLLTFAYLILFPALLFGSAHVYDRQDDAPRLRLVSLVYGLNYLVCLPFYLFFPVYEPWSFAPSHVVPLTDVHVHPWLIDIVRPMSGIDNCFPSYHTSLSVSLMLVARAGGPSRFATASTIAALLIVASTVYLGFHWLLDLTAGTLAGWCVFALARRMVAQPVAVPVAVPRGD